MPGTQSAILWGPTFENVLRVPYPLDNLRPRRRPRPGSTRGELSDGTPIAWSEGKDYLLDLELRWTPYGDIADPVGTGWGGPIGVEEFLSWAPGRVFRFVPDITVPDFYVDACRLLEPFEDPAPGLERDGSFRQPILIANPLVSFAQALRGIMFEYAPGSSLIDPVTATFASSGTRFRTAKSRVMTAEAGIRDGHYTPGGLRTTLLERGFATAGWDRSEELNHANWTKLGSNTVGQDAGRGGDGTQTADTLIESAVNEAHAFQRQMPAHTDNTLQSVGVCGGFFGSRQWFRIKTINKANVQISTWFNVATGAIGTIGGGHTNVRTELVGPVGAQSWRCSLTFDSGAGATTPMLQVHMATADAGGDYAGDGTSRIAFWGMQFDVDSPFLSSYVKDGAARPAETFTWPFLYKPQPIFLFEDFVEYGSVLTAAAVTRNVGISDPTNERIGIYKATTGYEGYHQTTTFRSSQVGSAVPVLGDVVQHVLTVDSQGRPQLHQVINGGTEVVATIGGAEPFADAFGQPVVAINSAVDGSARGSNAFRRVKVGPLIFNGITRDTVAKALAA